MALSTAKLADVKRLLDKLTLDLQKICMLPHREHDGDEGGAVRTTRLTDTERDAALEQLKLYGRDPVDAEPIFTKEVRMDSVTCNIYPVVADGRIVCNIYPVVTDGRIACNIYSVDNG